MSVQAIRLRELIRGGSLKIVMGVGSPDHALMAEKAGHECLYLSGFAIACQLKGVPDMGLLTREENWRQIDATTERVSIPLMVDADDGYGGIHQTQKTVADIFGKTRAAGLHLEDQMYPKRCGHIAGKDVILAEEFVGKLKAAIEVRDKIDPTRIIMARTDAFGASSGRPDPKFGGDMQEAIRRGRMYAEAGVDLVWAEFPDPRKSTAEAFAEGMMGYMPPLGLGFNESASFSEKWFTFPDPVTVLFLKSLNFKFIFATYIALIKALKAVLDISLAWNVNPELIFLSTLDEAGSTPAGNIRKFTGADEYQDTEARLSALARARLEGSTSGDFKSEKI